ncbi:MAG: 4Fe-4S dicluster domain-containing protein [Deltaproteobacteria bacterium]|nr:4Fe-4S dicluster domain-containing protein [Candidatus Zymogenaceae bacterium]
MNGILSIDAARCVACGRCILACITAHSRAHDLAGAVADPPYPTSRIAILDTGGTPAVILCRHCKKPRCAQACPASAIEKLSGGEVILDADRCTGCGACADACPFGVPITARDGQTYVTCDLCADLRAQGGTPACAGACHSGAIVYQPNQSSGRAVVVYERSAEGNGIYLRMTGTRRER